MTLHISTLINWHDRGWEGCICDEPEKNPYCTGPHSYFDKLIRGHLEKRDRIDRVWNHCDGLEDEPPCFFSINTFGRYSVKLKLRASKSAPSFDKHISKIPPGTYFINVKDPEKYPDEEPLRSLKNVDQDSLVFYYLNDSNPVSHARILVGVSQIEKVSDPICLSEYNEPFYLSEIRTRFPEVGFVLPLHTHQDDEELVVFPENKNSVLKGISDDQAIGCLEKVIPAINRLISIGDKSFDWISQLSWVEDTLRCLWMQRGLYPGRKQIDALFSSASEEFRMSLARFDLSASQLQIFKKLQSHGINLTKDKILDNPYLLSEITVKAHNNFKIRWEQIDRGIFPHACLGAESQDRKIFEDRARAAATIWIREKQQNLVRFEECSIKIQNRINRISKIRGSTITSMIDVDQVLWSSEDLKVFNDQVPTMIGLQQIQSCEELIKETVDAFLKRQRIVVPDNLDALISIELAKLGKQVPEQFAAIRGALTNSIYVISGTAGSGKSSVVSVLLSLLHEIWPDEKCLVLAPTGKAKAVLRERVIHNGVKGNPDIKIIDGLLKRRRWWSVRYRCLLQGDRAHIENQTLIIDEMSMVDTEKLATLFRAVDLDRLNRIILIGDHKQLPPIEVGCPFADLINYLGTLFPEKLSVLSQNLRIEKKDTKLGKLAKLTESHTANQKTNWKSTTEAALLDLLKPEDSDTSLIIDYWDDEKNLFEILEKWLPFHLEDGQTTERSARDCWQRLWTVNQSNRGNPSESHCNAEVERGLNLLQVVTPFRVGLTGVYSLNSFLQSLLNPQPGNLRFCGFGCNDKVIQSKNAKSIIHEGTSTRSNLFNGQIGLTESSPQIFSRKELKALAVRFLYKERRVLFNISNPPDGLELAYALTVHKTQGSEFERVIFILPKGSHANLQCELFHTAITRSRKCCHLMVQDGMDTILKIIDPNNSALVTKTSTMLRQSQSHIGDGSM